MSTRANIQIIESYSWQDQDSKKMKINTNSLWFYRHSDGYPDGTLPTLKKFCKWIKDGKIRSNLSQAAGWLIIIGADEYSEHRNFDTGKDYKTNPLIPDPKRKYNQWKVGAYEPTTEMYGEIEFLYVITLHDKRLKVQKRVYSDNYNFDDDPEFKTIETIKFSEL